MIKVSGVAIGEWNGICNIKNNRTMTECKILRAYICGSVSHVYEDKNYIVRYFNLNLLVSKDGIIMTVWRDNSRPLVEVEEGYKKYISNYTINDLKEEANAKEKLIKAGIENGRI